MTPKSSVGPVRCRYNPVDLLNRLADLVLILFADVGVA